MALIKSFNVPIYLLFFFFFPCLSLSFPFRLLKTGILSVLTFEMYLSLIGNLLWHIPDINAFSMTIMENTHSFPWIILSFLLEQHWNISSLKDKQEQSASTWGLSSASLCLSLYFSSGLATQCFNSSIQPHSAWFRLAGCPVAFKSRLLTFGVMLCMFMDLTFVSFCCCRFYSPPPFRVMWPWIFTFRACLCLV